MRHAEPAMGTVFSFDIRDDVPADALTAAIGWLHWVDRVFSPYRADSEISRLGRGELTVADCPPEVAEVLDLAKEIARVSDGYFTERPAGRFDPSGVVKGWAVERASDLVRAGGSAHHAINGGGDVQLVGAAAPGQPWRVGIADPFHPGQLVTVVTGHDCAVATSGTAERGTHIVNPHSGRPARELASITLVGEHLRTVDAYATAAFAMGSAARAWVDQLDGIEAFAVTATGASWCSRGWAEVGATPAPGPGIAPAPEPVLRGDAELQYRPATATPATLWP